MSIKTHYGVGVLGIDDNAYEAKSIAQKNMTGGCCKQFFPTSEGANGPEAVGLVTQDLTPTIGTMNWTSDVVSYSSTSEMTLVTPGTFPSIATSSVFFAVFDTEATTWDFNFGQDGSTGGWVLSEAFCRVRASANQYTRNLSSYYTAASGLSIGQAVVVEDNDSVSGIMVGDVSFYENNPNVTVLYTGDIIPAADKAKMASVSLYGAAVFTFADGLPNDLVAGLEWMNTQWREAASVVDGTKRQIYPSWANLG